MRINDFDKVIECSEHVNKQWIIEKSIERNIFNSFTLLIYFRMAKFIVFN